jgi:hypothetical protein
VPGNIGRIGRIDSGGGAGGSNHWRRQLLEPPPDSIGAAPAGP